MIEPDFNLNNRKIAITRAADSISDVKNLFVRKGAKIFEFPSLIIQYPEDLRPLDKAISGINSFHWLIFSSSNGIKFMNKRLVSNGSSLKEFAKNIKVAVVGVKTSQSLNKLGIEADFVPSDFVADSLLEEFPISPKDLRILIPRVQTGGRNIIAEKFINLGALVTQVAAYESICPDSIPQETLDTFKNKTMDAIIFSSGKTVDNSAYLLNKYLDEDYKSLLSEVKLFSIGPQTSLACKKQFGRVDGEANEYTFEGLLDLVLKYFN